jgi:hypothetical protein
MIFKIFYEVSDETFERYGIIWRDMDIIIYQTGLPKKIRVKQLYDDIIIKPNTKIIGLRFPTGNFLKKDDIIQQLKTTGKINIKNIEYEPEEVWIYSPVLFF